MKDGRLEVGDMYDCPSCLHRHALGGTCVHNAVTRTNLDDALDIVAEIDRVRAVMRELKAAFARSELDGGVKAAPDHPIYQDAELRLAELHERLLILV